MQAVDAGRGKVSYGHVADLLIDGRFCDHVATHELFRAGLMITEPRTVRTSRCRLGH